MLIAVDGYRYGGKGFDRTPVIRQLQEAMPSLDHTVLVPYLDPGATGDYGAEDLGEVVLWDELRRAARGRDRRRLRKTSARAIRERCRSHHVPDEVQAIVAVPRTLSGKLAEVPTKRILIGAEPAKVVSRDLFANPETLHWVVDRATDMIDLARG